jgi:hypothetical protein
VTRIFTTLLIAEQFPTSSNNHFDDKYRSGKKSLAFLFEEINALKRQLKPEKTASSKKRKAESILFTEINLTTNSDEGEQQEYLFTSSKPFSSSKIISSKQQPLSWW